ncbi:MAG: phosphoglycolate phosphatase [Gammaproteobacteria bacterium]
MSPWRIPRPVVAVLFDLDGTLIDSAPDLASAAERMRARRGLPALPLAQYRPHASSGARGMLRIGFGADPGHVQYESLRQEFLDEYAAGLMERTAPFDGVAQMLDVLERAGCPWGIVTNKAERFTLPMVAGLPLLGRAAAVISGDTTPHAKPHPAPLLEAARRLGVDPGDCLYVGDDERDIVAGRAAGMFTVAACYGYMGSTGSADHWQADACIEFPEQLLKLLELP